MLAKMDSLFAQHIVYAVDNDRLYESLCVYNILYQTLQSSFQYFREAFDLCVVNV